MTNTEAILRVGALQLAQAYYLANKEDCDAASASITQLYDMYYDQLRYRKEGGR